MIINWFIKLKMQLDNKVLVSMIKDKYKSGEISGLINGENLYLNLMRRDSNIVGVQGVLVSIEEIILKVLTEDINKMKEKYPFPKPLDTNRISSILENEFSNNNELYNFISDLKKKYMPEAQRYTEYIINTLIEIFKSIFIAFVTAVITVKLTGLI